jgi:hypothetical protein
LENPEEGNKVNGLNFCFSIVVPQFFLWISIVIGRVKLRLETGQLHDLSLHLPPHL